MRDMTPPGDRRQSGKSIRDIPVSSSSHRRNTPPARFQGDIPVPHRRRGPRRLFWIALVGIVLACGAAGVLMATLFQGATITIVPKMQKITPPANIVALPNAQGGNLGYQTIALAQSATTTVNASGSTQVSKAASGLITISNSFSVASQPLVTNTRFEAADGKIYRIHSPITIPGAQKKADGTLTPGTITATVYADAPGDSYNRPNATTFSIPGFKGDPKYTKITAQSAAGAITGGFVGEQASVSPADMQSAQQALKNTLEESLRGAVNTQVPTGFLPVQGSLVISFSDILQTKGEGTSVTLSQTAHASMAMVPSATLAANLAKLLVSGYNGEAVDFNSPNPLILQVSTSTGSANTGPLNILLQGSPTLVWQFDTQALVNMLLDKDKTTFQTAISNFAPAIEKAQASVRPFWKQTFPTDPTKVDIVIDVE